MKTTIKGVGLIIILATWAAGNLLRAQVPTEWPIMDGTPANTRFANVSYPGEPMGILWRDPSSTDPTYAICPILSQGLVILGTSALSGVNHGTRILDARTGQTLYVLKVPGMGTVQALGEAVLGDGQKHRLLFLNAMESPSFGGSATTNVGNRPR